MRVLGPIVLPQTLLMPRRQSKFPECRSVGSELVRDDNPWCKSLVLKKLAHQLQRGSTVTPGLDQEVQNLTFAINSTPKIYPLAADRDEHLVQVPLVVRFWPAPSKPLSIEVSEFQNPPPDRFVGNVDSAFRQKFLDIPKAKREP